MRCGVGCVVEGHGEVEALPLLLRRLRERFREPVELVIPPPVRMNRSDLKKPGRLERAIRLAAAKAEPAAGVLVLLDADRECPAVLGPELSCAMQEKLGTLPIEIVFATIEFESWFLAAAESLRGYRGLPQDLTAPPDAETIRGAKEWLSRNMPQPYSPVVDQPKFTAKFDLDQAATARSFGKLQRAFLKILKSPQPTP